MKLNFLMEVSGFILVLFLSIVTTVRHHVIDLKDRLYVKMVHCLTVFTAMNIISSIIIRNNILELEKVAEIGIYMNFWLLVWIIYYVNLYMEESICRFNRIPVSSYVRYGFPSFCNLILLIVNLGNNCVFELAEVDSKLKLIYNSMYVVPYILAILSLIISIIYILLPNREKISNKRQMIFYIIPLVYIVIFYIQFTYKAVATFGFGCAMVMLILYLYSYDYIEKFDYLTNLPNKHCFNKMLEYRVGNDQSMYVVMLKLNDYAYLRNEYNLKTIDSFICAVGDFLSEISPKNCLARFDEDLFAIIIEGKDEEKLKAWIEVALKRFEEKWQVGKVGLELSASIVVVSYPDMCEDVKEIKKVLNYLLKNFRENSNLTEYIIYDENHKNQLMRRQKIVSMLKEIIHSGNMYVEYQPIYDSVNNAYTKGEAIYCLKDSILGEVPPEEMIPIAEEHGYMLDIGYILIDKVCQYMKSFMDNGQHPPVISVNFTRMQLMADGIGEKIIKILNKYDLKPYHIAIEVPEEVFAIHSEQVQEQIMILGEQGFRFYLDGLGIGFLEIPRIIELPFELIKINKIMMQDAEKNDAVYMVVSAMTAVLEENGKEILGDGIEFEHLKEIADMLFMTYMQGYYLSAPISGEEAKKIFLRKDVFKQKNNAFDQISSEIDMLLSRVEQIIEEEDVDIEKIHNSTFEMEEDEVNQILASLKEEE